AIRKYHRQMLTKAIEAIDQQDVREREFQGVTVAIDHRQLPEAKAALEKFVMRFNQRFSKSPKATAVYQMSLAFFRLDKVEP
ncbi:MAG: DUF4423 domain-containing protein, partial [Bdellovibrionales bacterium]